MADPHILTSKFPPAFLPDTDIYTFIQTGFRKNPSRLALVNSYNRETSTYAELEEKHERAAYHMAENGVGQGDIVCFYGQNCLEYVTMMLATWRVGGVVCAITKLLTGLFCRDELPGGITYTSLIRPIPSGKRAPAKPKIKTDDAACLLFSSGTTGLPKAVELSHKNLITAIVAAAHPHVELLVESVILLVPMSHIYGMMVNLGTLYQGGTNIIMDQFDLETYLQLACKYKVTSLHLVPPLVILIAKHPIVSKYDLSHVEQVFCGAAPLGEETVAEFKQRLGKNIYFQQGYGLTESTAMVAITPPKTEGIVMSLKSVGVPLPGVEVKVTDLSTGESLGPDRNGEICFRGTNLMTGYVKNKAATADAMDASGFFHTGDLGYYNKQGHIFVVDRLKELIKYKGYQVAPAELKDVLLSHPQVADCAVIGIPNTEASELPHAWIVKKPGTNLSEKDIVVFVAEKLAPFKHLRGGVTFVDQIPKSATGKIMRKEIRLAMTKPKGKL